MSTKSKRDGCLGAPGRTQVLCRSLWILVEWAAVLLPVTSVSSTKTAWSWRCPVVCAGQEDAWGYRYKLTSHDLKDDGIQHRQENAAGGRAPPTAHRVADRLILADATFNPSPALRILRCKKTSCFQSTPSTPSTSWVHSYPTLPQAMATDLRL